MKLLQTYHAAWLSVHPDRDEEWLRARLLDGFHVHHKDGDHSNDDPTNLVLIEGVDHLRLHGMRLESVRPRSGRRPQKDKPAKVGSNRVHSAAKNKDAMATLAARRALEAIYG